jgi:hypothetical protein
MFRNLDNDGDTEVGHTRSGREFKEVHLANLLKRNYGDEGCYSREEEDLMDKEHLEPVREKEGKAEEPHQEESKSLGTAQTVEVSTIIPHVDSIALRNQSNPSH